MAQTNGFGGRDGIERKRWCVAPPPAFGELEKRTRKIGRKIKRSKAGGPCPKIVPPPPKMVLFEETIQASFTDVWPSGLFFRIESPPPAVNEGLGGPLEPIKLGTMDMPEAETEWLLRPYMNTAKKRRVL